MAKPEEGYTDALIGEWPEEGRGERAHRCIVYLYVHGFLTEAERRAVRRRLDRAAWPRETQDPAPPAE